MVTENFESKPLLSVPANPYRNTERAVADSHRQNVAFCWIGIAIPEQANLTSTEINSDGVVSEEIQAQNSVDVLITALADGSEINADPANSSNRPVRLNTDNKRISRECNL